MGSHESGGSGRRLNAVGVQLLIASGDPLLSGRMRCPVCGRGGEPSVAHVVLGECSAGATTRERCEIVKSLERSADTYPWSYESGEDRYDSDGEIGDDEEEGETRLREICGRGVSERRVIERWARARRMGEKSEGEGEWERNRR